MTLLLIDAFDFRYANQPSLGAIELMNEPNAQIVQFSTLRNYYQKGYDAVRKYSSNAYVIMSNRLGDASNTEFLSLAGGLDRTVIDVHYYNLYSDQFKNMNIQQNIDYIRNTRSTQLQEVTQSNGRPLSFVGEFQVSTYHTCNECVKNGVNQEYVEKVCDKQTIQDDSILYNNQQCLRLLFFLCES